MSHYAIYNTRTNKPVQDTDGSGNRVVILYTNKPSAQAACNSIDDEDFEVRAVELVPKTRK